MNEHRVDEQQLTGPAEREELGGAERIHFKCQAIASFSFIM